MQGSDAQAELIQLHEDWEGSRLATRVHPFSHSGVGAFGVGVGVHAFAFRETRPEGQDQGQDQTSQDRSRGGRRRR